MGDKVDMALDDIIKSTKGSSKGGVRRGGGRGRGGRSGGGGRPQGRGGRGNFNRGVSNGSSRVSFCS